MQSTKIRKKVFICNLIITFLCILSIVGYFIMPFWKVEVSYTLTADSIKEMLDSAIDDASAEDDNASTQATKKAIAATNAEENDENESDENTDENESDEGANSGESGGFDLDNALNEMDFSEIVGEEGLTISLSLQFETKDILSSYTDNPETVVENILNENVSNLVDQFTPTINKIAKSAVKMATRTVLKEELKEQVKNNLPVANDEEAQRELDEMGLTDEYIKTQTDKLVDTFYEDDMTPEKAADATVEVVEDAITKMKESGKEEFADIELSEENKAELREEITEVLEEFTDDEGNLDMDGFVSKLLSELINSSEGEDDYNTEGADDYNTEIKGMRAVAPLAASGAQGSSDEAAEISEELKADLTKSLMEQLDDSVEIIALVFKCIGYVILFSFATWAYLILKILVKMGMKNNAIKLKLPILLGSIPFVVLQLIPSTAVWLLKSQPSWIFDKIEMSAEDLAEIDMVMQPLNIRFSCCAWLSFVIGCALFFFVIFYYGKLRRKMKKIKRNLLDEYGEEIGANAYDGGNLQYSNYTGNSDTYNSEDAAEAAEIFNNCRPEEDSYDDGTDE